MAVSRGHPASYTVFLPEVTIQTMLEFIQFNPFITRWILGISLVLFVGTIIAVPYLITLIPEDYFSHDRRTSTGFSGHHPVIRLVLILLKNIIGYSLIILGMVMLVLPGQGILTMLIGFVLIDFPNKYQMERWLVSLPRVLKTMNWFRRRSHKKPLIIK
jgi:archaellum biogenesis protein FlaJ (TadC family)